MNKFNEIGICAFDEGMVDLDEHKACENLQQRLGKYREADNIQKISLNLERCWIDYSFSFLYLDEAINLLLNSNAKCEKILELNVSIDLGEPHFMAALLFPMSKLISSNMDKGPIGLLEDIGRFCCRSNITIVVNSIMRDRVNNVTSRRFDLGNGKTSIHE